MAKLFILGLLGLLVGGGAPGARGAGGLVIKDADQDVRRRAPRLPSAGDWKWKAPPRSRPPKSVRDAAKAEKGKEKGGRWDWDGSRSGWDWGKGRGSSSSHGDRPCW